MVRLTSHRLVKQRRWMLKPLGFPPFIVCRDPHLGVSGSKKAVGACLQAPRGKGVPQRQLHQAQDLYRMTGFSNDFQQINSQPPMTYLLGAKHKRGMYQCSPDLSPGGLDPHMQPQRLETQVLHYPPPPPSFRHVFLASRV